MPIYEYVCEKCGHAFEHLARSYTAPAPVCPKCNSEKTKKQFSTFSSHTATACDHCSSGDICAGSGGSGHHCCGAGCGCHGH